MSEGGLTKEQKIHKRIRLLEAFILSLFPGTEKVSVHTYRDIFKGLRVGEISLTTGSGGCAWMRSDPDGLAVCAAAEEVILTAGHRPWRPVGWESKIDVHGDAKGLLRELMLPKKRARRKA